MALVSIIVPVYKVEQYLDRCVRSIRDQTYRDLEIILVDDGSPDNCGRMCDQYMRKDERIKVIHKKNGGLSDARNAGIREATGKYLLFVDSDDEIKSDLVEKTVKVAEEKDCDIVLFDFFHIENGIQEWRTGDVPCNEVISLQSVPRILLMPPAACLKLYKRDFFVGCGHFFMEGIHYEDFENTPKLYLEANKIVYLKEPFYYYWIRENSIMTSTDYNRYYKDITFAADSIIEFYKKKGAYEKYYSELEYLIFINVYFEPSRKIILCDRKMPCLKKYRKYMYKNFPGFHQNKYVKRLNIKNKWHLKLLDTEQYWLMSLLSKCRQVMKK